MRLKHDFFIDPSMQARVTFSTLKRRQQRDVFSEFLLNKLEANAIAFVSSPGR
jgi:hypothetical protein